MLGEADEERGGQGTRHADRPLACLCCAVGMRPQDEFSVHIYEEVVRFHLLSEHELCEEEASSERWRLYGACGMPSRGR